MKRTHQRHVLGISWELPVENKINPSLVHLPLILERGHVVAVL